MEFINKMLDYFKSNPVFAAVILACVVFIAIVVVVICVLASKAKKSKQTTVKSEQPAPTTAKPEQSSAIKMEEKAVQPAPAPVVPEKKEEPVAPPTPVVVAEKAPVATVQTPDEKPATPVKTEPAREEKVVEKAATKKPQTKTEKAKPVAKAQPKPEKAEVKEEKPEPVKKARSTRYNGKWTICHLITKDENLGENSTEETYFFELLASNGEKLLSSEEYTSYNGVLKGIETHKANILKNNFRIGLSKKGEYIFKLLNGKNSLLCTGENYPTKIRCENAIESTKRFAQTAVLDENVHDIIVQIPLDTDESEEDYDPGYIGKWIISKTTAPDGDEIYYFELFASNGEKLLSSEEYTSYTGALNGIGTHKNNIEKDNFRIALTKRGDYIYKLLTGNGQLLCLGEHYKTRRRCESAVESVKRFAKSAPILTASNIAPKNE